MLLIINFLHLAVTVFVFITNSILSTAVAYPGVLFGGRRGFNKFSLGQRNGDLGGGSPLVRGSGGSCNLVQEISFHIVKFS